MGQNAGQGLEDAVCRIPSQDGGDRIEEASSGGSTGQIPGSRSLREGVWSLQVGGAVASQRLWQERAVIRLVMGKYHQAPSGACIGEARVWRQIRTLGRT